MLSDQKGSDNIQVCSSLAAAAAVSGNVNRLVEHNVTHAVYSPHYVRSQCMIMLIS